MKNVFDELAVRAIAQQLLSMSESDFPHRRNPKFAASAGIDDSEVFPHCPFCKRPGLFAIGNGSIDHTSECAITLAYRISQ